MFRLESHTKKHVSAYSFITLITENKAQLSKRGLTGADQTRELYRKIGYPGYQHFSYLQDTDYFRNCTVTTDDVKRALYIYGKDIVALKGKMTRLKASPIINTLKIEPPKSIVNLHPTVKNSADYVCYTIYAIFAYY